MMNFYANFIIQNQKKFKILMNYLNRNQIKNIINIIRLNPESDRKYDPEYTHVSYQFINLMRIISHGRNHLGESDPRLSFSLFFPFLFYPLLSLFLYMLSSPLSPLFSAYLSPLYILFSFLISFFSDLSFLLSSLLSFFFLSFFPAFISI